ncbi:HAAS signaling domain-containing protein [Micromonosporaceae bacterium Da 78-11]
MTTAPLAHTDAIVLDYLAALWAQSDELSPDQRDELMSTVADYIAVRRTSIDDPTEIIRRLGPPEELIAAAARGRIPAHVRLPALVAAPSAPVPAARAPGGLEYTAIGLLTVGAFLVPVAAPVAGLLLVSGSAQWTPGQKATAWLYTGGSGAAGLLLTLLFASLPFGSGAAIFLIYLAVCAGSAVAGLRLHREMRQA